jgi:hypothetical protein
MLQGTSRCSHPGQQDGRGPPAGPGGGGGASSGSSLIVEAPNGFGGISRFAVDLTNSKRAWAGGAAAAAAPGSKKARKPAASAASAAGLGGTQRINSFFRKVA